MDIRMRGMAGRMVERGRYVVIHMPRSRPRRQWSVLWGHRGGYPAERKRQVEMQQQRDKQQQGAEQQKQQRQAECERQAILQHQDVSQCRSETRPQEHPDSPNRGNKGK